MGDQRWPPRRRKPPTKTCVAELFASNGTELSGVVIDAHSVRITLRDADLAIGTTEGLPIIRFALKRRNSCITEVAGSSSRTASLTGTDF